MRQLPGFLLIATPFLFGVLRLISADGVDARYILVAGAALAGAAVAYPRGERPRRVGAWSLVAGTVLGAVAAALVAWLLGARSLVSASVVSLSFGACVAGGFFLLWRAALPRAENPGDGTV